MIRIGSRYEQSEVFYTLDGRTGNTRPTVMRANPQVGGAASPSQSVKWPTGARLDRISTRVLGSPERWWVIMDRNPDILDPMSITTGATVRIR